MRLFQNTAKSAPVKYIPVPPVLPPSATAEPAKKVGRVVTFNKPAYIVGSSAYTGAKESEGLLKDYIKNSYADVKADQKTFEKAECKMFLDTIKDAVCSAGLTVGEINILLAGDLLNQIVSSAYAARELGIPFFGTYGACATMAQCLFTAAALLNGGAANYVACATGSHFATAERQYRGPLEFGQQKQPYSQWTVTGAGCSILGLSGKGPRITKGIIGQVVDYGVTDMANMGAAMAPAAADTIKTFLYETDTAPKDYDLIVTGDLGKLGGDILRQLLFEEGVDLGTKYNDCGWMTYNHKQKAVQGGSGCGCSAVALNTYLMDKLRAGKFKNLLFCATGALMSLTTSQQGETIPSITHAVLIESNVESN